MNQGERQIKKSFADFIESLRAAGHSKPQIIRSLAFSFSVYLHLDQADAEDWQQMFNEGFAGGRKEAAAFLEKHKGRQHG